MDCTGLQLNLIGPLKLRTSSIQLSRLYLLVRCQVARFSTCHHIACTQDRLCPSHKRQLPQRTSKVQVSLSMIKWEFILTIIKTIQFYIFSNRYNVMRSGGKSRPNLSPPSKFKVSPEERLSPEDLEELKQIFDLLDEDKTGKIDPNELYQLLQELGLTHRSPVLNTLLNDFTTNKTLTFEEFLTLFCNRLGDTKSKGGLEKLFQLFDIDNTGYIDLANLKVAAKQLGETMNQQELFQVMHNTHILNKTQSNEFFTFEEFYSIVTRKRY